MNRFFASAAKNWKTTASAILTSTLAITGYMLESGQMKPHTAFILGLIQICAHVAVGLMQKDASAHQGDPAATKL